MFVVVNFLKRCWGAPNENGNAHLFPVEHLYFGVYDGHCGSWVAQALTTNLYKKLYEAKVYENAEEKINYEEVVRQVFLDLDKVICEKLNAEKWNDGSTCVTVSFTPKGEMVFAHTG